MSHKITYKMNYTQYRTTEEINSVLELVKQMWEANNHLSLCKLLNAISIHKGVELKHLSDPQLEGYISNILKKDDIKRHGA